MDNLNCISSRFNNGYYNNFVAMIDIQSNIKSLLREKGILHKQVALSLGITEAGLSNWFNRKTDLSFGQISRICEVGGFSVVDAVTYPEKYVPQSEARITCDDCRKKDKIIDYLTELLDKYKEYEKK